jgi:hypothetical protein
VSESVVFSEGVTEISISAVCRLVISVYHSGVQTVVSDYQSGVQTVVSVYQSGVQAVVSF